MIETQVDTRSAVVPFRLRPDELSLVKQQARQDRLPISEWVRRVVLAEISPMKGSNDD